MNSDQLIEHLAHPNKWHRQTAVRLLGKIRNDNLTKKLIDWTKGKKNHYALGGLWALHQSGQLDENLCVQLLQHPYAGIRSWIIRFLGDKKFISASTAIELRKLAQKETNLEVWSQIASTAQRIDGKKSLPVLAELLARAGDLEDPYLPLMYWWAIEKHCQKNSAEVLKIFEKTKVRNQPMVQKEILPRLMRRFATSGGEKNYLICAKLINLCDNDVQKNAVMSGFEKAFEGGSLPSLPNELIEAIRNTGTAVSYTHLTLPTKA